MKHFKHSYIKKIVAIHKKRKLTTDNPVQKTNQVPSSHLVLSGLPNDILTIIFTFLYHSNPLNYLNLRRVCRTFNTLLTTQPISSDLDFSKFNPPLSRGGDTLLQQLLNLIKPTSIFNMHTVNSRNKIKYDPLREFMTLPFWPPSETHITYKGLESISQNCSHLTHLDLSGCEEITDAGLASLKVEFPKLTSLNLRQCTNITDKGVLSLTQNCPNLTSLNLAECDNITGDGLIAIAKNCKELTSLDLSYCGNITDDGLVALAQNCPNLTSLDLAGCHNITNEGLAALEKAFPNLTSLNLSGCKNITGENLDALGKFFPKLTSLYLAGCDKITDVGLIAIAENCKELTSLDLAECDNITDEGLVDFTQHCTNLTSLGLMGLYKITDTGFAALAQHCPHIIDLALGYTEITDKEIIEIVKNYPNLTHLDLRGCDCISYKGIEALVNLKNLKVFSFTDTLWGNIFDEEINALYNLDKVTYYKLPDEYLEIENSCLIDIAKNFPNLRDVDLSNNVVLTIAGIEDMIQHCKQLKSLNLSSSVSIYDNSSDLSCLQNLTSLNLSSSSINSEILEQLKSLTNLTSLNVCDTGLTDVELEKLKEALPNCSIFKDE